MGEGRLLGFHHSVDRALSLGCFLTGKILAGTPFHRVTGGVDIFWGDSARCKFLGTNGQWVGLRLGRGEWAEESFAEKAQIFRIRADF